MANENKGKLNRLFKSWLPGTVAVQAWLSTLDISPNLTTWYIRSGWLLSIGRGAYIRAGDQVDWTGGIYAIQEQLKLPIHIAAKTALEIAGRTHYVRLGETESITLFSPPNITLPAWFKKNDQWDIEVNFYSAHLFVDLQLGIAEKKINNYSVKIATLERAMTELLYLVPQYQTLEEAYLIMENLISLRPDLVQQLLENCCSIKVKRLFMHLAEECNHSWIKYVNTDKINFGKGKRMIAGGGVYHEKYQLSLPVRKEE